MLSKSYDKSAQGVCCTNEDEHDHVASSDHRAASPPTLELGSRLSEKTSNDGKFFNVRVPSRILSLCGGGHLCIAHLGVLKALRDKHLLKYIQGLIGVSAGALVALLCVLGYTIEQIELLMHSIDLTMFTNVESESALLFYQTLCINSGQKLDAFLVSILEQKGLSPDVTFSQLYGPQAKRRPFFRCYATRLQKSDIQEFSLEKTPNHSILFALRASMCLPVVFAPMKDPFTEILYYDAALIHNMPFAFLTEEEKQQTLSVYFDVFSAMGDGEDITSIFKYAFKSFYNMRNTYYLKRYTDSIVSIPVDYTKLLDCTTKESKDDLIAVGYANCSRMLNSRSRRVVVRRYSVS
jgi:predicted acylesterase/phospholipase RssA